MGIEFEAKFLHVNVELIRNKLKNIGAKIEHNSLKFYRAVFFRCNNEDPPIKGYVRIRDEGTKITMTVKTYKNEKKLQKRNKGKTKFTFKRINLSKIWNSISLCCSNENF